MLRTKRCNDPVDPDDGWRLLVTRYRPRGLPKAKETWDAWWPMLGPSRALHAAWYGKSGPPPSWEEFAERYRTEMLIQAGRIALLATRINQGETITLLCSSACTDSSRCHRSLLAALITD